MIKSRIKVVKNELNHNKLGQTQDLKEELSQTKPALNQAQAWATSA